jgi:soluble lytic murein transglycosylase-like protein
MLSGKIIKVNSCGVNYTVDKWTGIVTRENAIESYPVNSANYKIVKKIADVYGPVIQKNSARYNIPAGWILGIMFAEAGTVIAAGKIDACSPCEPNTCSFYPNCQPCCAYGLMQVIHTNLKRLGYEPSQVQKNPALAIEAGCRILRECLDRTGDDIVKGARMYNGGSGCKDYIGLFRNGAKSQGDHPGKTVLASNTAIINKLIKSDSSMFFGITLAATGIAIAFYLNK